jgi:hypothetical protein
MKMRPLDVLSPLGILLLIGLLIGMPGWVPGSPRFHLALAAGLIVAHVTLRWEDIVRTVGRRQLLYGGNALIFSLAVFGILIIVNALVYRHTKRWDFTKGQRHSLSEPTRKILRSLKEDVRILYFENWDATGSQSVQDRVTRINEYGQVTPHVKVEFVDHRKDPIRTRQYGITFVPTLVIERGDKREKVNSDTEQEIATALLKVVKDKKKVVCFLEGEGERDPDDSGERGYSKVKSGLTRLNYDVKKVLLLGKPEVPEECTAAVVAGPKEDLTSPVADRLRSFVDKGGRALLLVDPDLDEPRPNLVALLKDWNLEAGSGVIVDIYGRQFMGSPLDALGRFRTHEITKEFDPRIAALFPEARGVQPGTATVDRVTVQALVETMSEAEDVRGNVLTWSETELLPNRPVRYDDGKDKKGPLTLAAVVTVRVPERPSPGPASSASPPSSPASSPEAKPDAGPSPVAEPSPAASPAAAATATPSPSPTPSPEGPEDKPEGRVVVVGDADFASNGFVSLPLGNADFFLNSLTWLMQDSELISLRPKEQEDQRIMVREGQRRFVGLVALVFIPATFIVLGVVKWWRRR